MRCVSLNETGGLSGRGIPHSQNSGTSVDPTLPGQAGLCACDYVKDVDVGRLPELSGWAHGDIWVLGKEVEGQGQRRRCEDKQKWERRDGREAASQGTWQPLEARGAGMARFPPNPQKEPALLMTHGSPWERVGPRSKNGSKTGLRGFKQRDLSFFTAATETGATLTFPSPTAEDSSLPCSVRAKLNKVRKLCPASLGRDDLGAQLRPAHLQTPHWLRGEDPEGDLAAFASCLGFFPRLATMPQPQCSGNAPS